jgi:hypothetical protein
VDWILLVENSVHLGSFENTVMDLQIPKFWENVLISWVTISFSKS